MEQESCIEAASFSLAQTGCELMGDSGGLGNGGWGDDGGTRSGGRDEPGEGAGPGELLSGDPVEPPAGDDWEQPGAPGWSQSENGAVGKGLNADASEPDAGKASTSNSTKATSQGDSGASEDAASQDTVNKNAAKPSDASDADDQPGEPEGPPVFRGTTRGYSGSPGTQRVGITPTSSDPGVATTHFEPFGESVVQIALPGDLAGVATYEGYIASELEVGVDLSPEEFSARASVEILSGAARTILGRMGISIPGRIGIDDLSPVMEATPKLTMTQIERFIEEARGYGG